MLEHKLVPQTTNIPKDSPVFLARFCSLKDYFVCENFNIFEKNKLVSNLCLISVYPYIPCPWIEKIKK